MGDIPAAVAAIEAIRSSLSDETPLISPDLLPTLLQCCVLLLEEAKAARRRTSAAGCIGNAPHYDHDERAADASSGNNKRSQPPQKKARCRPIIRDNFQLRMVLQNQRLISGCLELASVVRVASACSPL